MRVYPSWFIDELVDENDKQRAISGELNSKNRVMVSCHTCGKQYQMLVLDIIIIGRQERKWGGICRECHVSSCGSRTISTNRKMRKPAVGTDIPQWALDELEPGFDISTSRGDKWNWVCPKHGVYSQRYSGHVNAKTGERRYGCKKCGAMGVFKQMGNRSPVELEVEEFLRSFDPVHASNLLDNTFEVDIYLEDIRFGVEVDGFGHEELPTYIYGKYKSEGKWWYKPEGYHSHKDELAAAQGIKLIHVTDSQWKTDREATEKYILSEIESRKEELYG